MSAEFSFRTTRGTDPREHLLKVRKAIVPTQEDLLYAGQRQRTRQLERTRRGADVNGRAFAPYSTKGPYYYDPNAGRGAKRDDKVQRAAVIRMHSKLKKGAAGSGSMVKSRTGRSLKFASYAAFKRWLGRSTVDLTGPRAPHMLQAIITAARSAKELAMGIYGEAAERATGHNQGVPKTHLPKRRFFAASSLDLKAMVGDIGKRAMARLKAL